MEGKKGWKAKHSEAMDKASNAIGGWLIKVQSGWAKWMQVHYGKLTPGYQKLVFALFFTITVSLSITQVVRSISGTVSTDHKPLRNASLKTKIPMLQKPMHSGIPVDKAVMKEVNDFESYLDSLSQTSSGRLKKQQYLDAHPGILDSIRELKELYGIKE
jgi:hypothetical protein